MALLPESGDGGPQKEPARREVVRVHQLSFCGRAGLRPTVYDRTRRHPEKGAVETAEKCGAVRDGSPTRSCRQRVDPVTACLPLSGRETSRERRLTVAKLRFPLEQLWCDWLLLSNSVASQIVAGDCCSGAGMYCC